MQSSRPATQSKAANLRWAKTFPSLVASVLIAGIPLSAQDFGGISPASRNPHVYGSGSVTVDYEGFTTPKYDILVAAIEIGRLEDVYVGVGDRVSKGDVIAKLEDGLQLEAVATAQWRAQMHGETDAAKAETELMKLRLDQLESLAIQEVARPDELKRALADWEIAKARELNAIEQDQLRRLELSRYLLQLQRRKVQAPLDGVVAELFHSQGEYVTPADPAVIRLVAVDQLYGVFNIPVEEISTVAHGDQVAVFMSGAATSVMGSVTSIAPEIDGESGTIKVKVLIENPGGTLRSGDRCRMKPARSQILSKGSVRTSASRPLHRIESSEQHRESGIR